MVSGNQVNSNFPGVLLYELHLFGQDRGNAKFILHPFNIFLINTGVYFRGYCCRTGNPVCVWYAQERRLLGNCSYGSL